MPVVDPQAPDVEFVSAELLSSAEPTDTDTARRNPVAEDPRFDVPAALGTNVLRVASGVCGRERGEGKGRDQRSSTRASRTWCPSSRS